MLTDTQLAVLTAAFRHGANDASVALCRWLGRASQISIEQVEQIPMGDANLVLGDREAPVCACVMQLLGRITGQLLLVFDDASGLALADLLLEKPVGTSKEWGEVEQSAALETANIVGCAYLNSLARSFPQDDVESHELVPSPPRFARDYSESLMQFAFMNQAMVSDVIFLTVTEFRIEDEPVDCNLLFVPDADCFSALSELRPA